MKTMKKTFKVVTAIMLSVALTIGMFPMTSAAVSEDEVTQLAAQEASFENSASSEDAGEEASGKEISDAAEEISEADEAAEEMSQTDEAAEDISEVDEAAEDISEELSEASSEAVSEASFPEDETAPEETGEALLLGEGEDNYTKVSGFTVTDYSGGTWSDGAARHLVDNDIYTKWGVTSHTTAFVEFKSSESFSPVGYILTTGNDTATLPNRNPKGWNIYARDNDNDAWTLIESVKGSSKLEAKNFEPYTFMLTNPDLKKQWSRFRFEVTEIQSGDGFQLSEFQFLAVYRGEDKYLENATISGIREEYDYTGKIIDLGYTVIASDGTVLKKDIDYTESLSASPVKSAGGYELTIKGIGEYTGRKTACFLVLSPDDVAGVIKEGVIEVGYKDFDDALEAWKEAGNGAKLKLYRDVERDSAIRVEYCLSGNDPMILDLNGHGIIHTGNSTGSVLCLIFARFELRDSGMAMPSRFVMLTEGRGTAVSDTRPERGLPGEDYLEVKGGFITGGKEDGGSGAGIFCNNSTVTISGGTICGNTNTMGGGIDTDYQSFITIAGGKIIGNTAAVGGAVAGSSRFRMTAGEIYGNITMIPGGGAIASSENFIIETTDTIYDGINIDGSDAAIVSAETANSNISKYGYISIGHGPEQTNCVYIRGGKNATSSGGAIAQVDLSNNMTPVTFTSQSGYHFEKFEDIENNGIKITWIDKRTVVVSGMPSGEVSVTVPDAVPNTSIYETYIPTDEDGEELKALQVSFHDRQWYIIDDNSQGNDKGTVTLLSADCINAMAYGGEYLYKDSEVKAYLDSLSEGNGEFADAADVLFDYDTGFGSTGKLFLLSEEEISKVPTNVLKCAKAEGADHNRWLLRDAWYMTGYSESRTVDGETGISSEESITDTRDACGVRPAISLKLNKVRFDTATKKFNYAPVVHIIKEPEAATGLIYTGAPQKLISAGKVDRGSFIYALTRSDSEPEDDEYSHSIPTGTDAGTYYVWYKTNGAYEAQKLSVKIEKAVYQGCKEVEYIARSGEQPDSISITLPDITKKAKYALLSETVSNAGRIINGLFVEGNILTLDTSGQTWRLGTIMLVRPYFESVNYEDIIIDVYVYVQGDPQTLWIEPILPADYTGAAIKPVPVVHFGDNILSTKDYTVSYKNNINAADKDSAKAPTVIVKGKGNCSGTASSSFTINKLDIGSAAAPDIALAYNGKVQKGKTTVTYELGGKKVTLKEKTDYTLSYPEDPKETGVYTVTITGTGNYTGTKSFTESIIGSSQMISKIKIPAIPAQDYSGKAFVLEDSQAMTNPGLRTRLLDKAGKEYKFTLKSGSTELVYGKDYGLSYENNLEVGTATVTVIGIGDYVGEKTAAFKINGVKLSSLKSDGFVKSFDYTGGAIEQTAFKFYYMEGKGKAAVRHDLVEGTDYTVQYDNNLECGTASVTYTGKGKYIGTVKKTYTIKGISITSASYRDDFSETTGRIGERTYMEFYDAKAKAFIYTGEAFDVAGPANAQTQVDNNGIYITAIDKNSKDPLVYLKNGVDYFVTYKNNVNPGTAEVVFTGKGRFTGSVKKTFKIKPYNIKDDTDGRLAIIATDSPFYRGGSGRKPRIIYSFRENEGEVGAGRNLTEGVDYTLKWANNNVVTTESTKKKPTVTIIGKGAFTGSVIKEFNITGNYLESGVNVLVEAKDIAYADKPGICRTTVTLTDRHTGKKLLAGTDYDKNFVYSYAAETSVKRAVYTGKKITGYEENVILPAGTAVDSKLDVIPAGTKIKVEIMGKDGYGGNDIPAEAYFYVVDKDHDLSKATIKISPKVYTGNKVTLTSEDISFTINKKKAELVLGEDYEIIEDPKAGYINKGTYKVTIKGKGEKGYGFSKTVSFKITAKTLNDAISPKKPTK